VAATGQGRTSVRIKVAGGGDSNIETGVPVLDHLLGLFAASAGFDLALSVEPGSAEVEIDAAARALGEALEEPLRSPGVRGGGSAAVPADEALAHVALEASGRPLLVSNVDLSQARVGGLATDLAARFLDRFARCAGLTLHVRLIEGSETQHVLEAIFKALGAALAEACAPRRHAQREEAPL
jgi:imidazoleglycerol-phosphate dehydratase